MRYDNGDQVSICLKACVEYLRKQGKYSTAMTPDVILLDLNMPRMNGCQVLHELKKDVHFKTIPVVILTTSQEEEDVAKSYAEGANCYITKPVDFDEFHKVVKEISDFWFKVVKLPKQK